MYARLTVYENVDLDLADRLGQWFDTLDSNPFADLPGYRGSMTLIDRDNARLVGIGFYASGDAAQESEALVMQLFEEARDEIPESIRPALEMQPASVGIYEITHRD